MLMEAMASAEMNANKIKEKRSQGSQSEPNTAPVYK